MWRNALACTSILALAACHSDRDAGPVAIGSGHPEPKSIEEVLASNDPVDLYIEAFGAFVFESSSSVNLSGEPGSAVTGHTKLLRSETGDYEFVREPLSPSGAAFLKFIHGRAYLKTGDAAGFHRVRDQEEFAGWQNHAFRELFDEFSKAGFNNPGHGTISESLICWTKSAGKLCIDSASGLPLSGSLTLKRNDGLAPRIEFKVESLPPKTVQISAP